MDDLYMKAATVVAVALAAFSSFPSTAQQQPEQQPQQSQSQSQSTATPGTAPSQQNAASGAPSAAAAQLKPVTGELESKLDSKSAKQGDSVVVKTREDLTFPGGAAIPRGSKLVGHITNVQARGDGKENPQIAIQFDHAELTGGQSMAIESVIKSVSPAADAGSAMGATIPESSSVSPQAAPGAGASSAPGSSGVSSEPNMAGNRPGMASSTTQPGSTDQTANSGMPAPGSIVARSGNVAIRTTAIPGVLLANDLNGLPFTNASGMLLGARRDIHLDGGTQMVVAVAAAPGGAGGGMTR